MDTLNNIIHELQLAQNFDDFLHIWFKYEDYFITNEGSIIFTQDMYTNPDLPSINMFNGYDHRFKSLFKNNNLTFINKNIATAYKTNKKPKFSIDYTVSFDTQFVSFIEKYFKNKHLDERIEIEEILYKLIDHDVQSDYTPYLIENMSKGENKDSIKQNLEYIIKFFMLDKSSSILLQNMKIKSTTEFRNKLLSINKNIDDPKYQSLYNEFSSWHTSLYIILMKIVIINIEEDFLEDKISVLMEFMHNELNTIFARELIFAKEFFNKDIEITFFNKVRVINKKTLSRLENMAWDFALMRFLERLFTARPQQNTDFFISYFITFDKGLSQLIDLYPIKAFVHFKKTNDFNVIPEINILDFLKEYNLFEKYFTEESIKERNTQRNNNENNIEILKKKLEKYIESKIT